MNNADKTVRKLERIIGEGRKGPFCSVGISVLRDVLDYAKRAARDAEQDHTAITIQKMDAEAAELVAGAFNRATGSVVEKETKRIRKELRMANEEANKAGFQVHKLFEENKALEAALETKVTIHPVWVEPSDRNKQRRVSELTSAISRFLENEPNKFERDCISGWLDELNSLCGNS